jgi:hypothetical protein
MKNEEEKLQMAVCDYIRLQYKDVIFNSDVGSGMKLTKAQAGKAKMMRSGRGHPDLFIAEPRGEHHGLFIELKAVGVKIYKKDGSLRADKHLEEQCEMLARLMIKGYYADFAVGFDEAKRIIDTYLNNE